MDVQILVTVMGYAGYHFVFGLAFDVIYKKAPMDRQPNIWFKNVDVQIVSVKQYAVLPMSICKSLICDDGCSIL